MKHASVEEQWSSLAKQIAKESIEGVLEGLSRNILIGSVDNQKFGEGFEIIIAGLGFGWWKTREEACDVANIISKAIEQYSDYYKDIIKSLAKLLILKNSNHLKIKDIQMHKSIILIQL